MSVPMRARSRRMIAVPMTAVKANHNSNLQPASRARATRLQSSSTGNASTIKTSARRSQFSFCRVNTLLVITNLPDRPAAEKMARELVERRLAACVNLMSPCHSVYHWQGAIETADEVPLFIKTTSARYPALQQAILDS